tara:strand:- start:72 stop:254 length:183 start_codon:yes stop_codon:yes gene_type:complete
MMSVSQIKVSLRLLIAKGREMAVLENVQMTAVQKLEIHAKINVDQLTRTAKRMVAMKQNV